MESKLLELARAVVSIDPFLYDEKWVNEPRIYCGCGEFPHKHSCLWLKLKNEVRRLDSQTTYTPQGESLEFAQPRKPMDYEA